MEVYNYKLWICHTRMVWVQQLQQKTRTPNLHPQKMSIFLCFLMALRIDQAHRLLNSWGLCSNTCICLKVIFLLPIMVNQHLTTIWENIFGTSSKHLASKSKNTRRCADPNLGVVDPNHSLSTSTNNVSAAIKNLQTLQALQATLFKALLNRQGSFQDPHLWAKKLVPKRPSCLSWNFWPNIDDSNIICDDRPLENGPHKKTGRNPSNISDGSRNIRAFHVYGVFDGFFDGSQTIQTIIGRVSWFCFVKE